MSNLANVYTQYGQSIWIDHLSRSWLDEGRLTYWIGQGCRGLTSNPTIFDQAIADDDTYNDDILRLNDQGMSAEDIYWELMVDDITRAAEELQPIYQSSLGTDGYVSVEVSPLVANDTEATITEAVALRSRFDAPNVLIKVPATEAGVAAMSPLMEQGINLNMTLIFSLRRYQQVAQTYIEALQRLTDDQIKTAFGVASFFISRVDTEVDDRLTMLAQGSSASELPPKGRAAVAQAKLAYKIYLDLFTDNPTWVELLAKGSLVQRPLWASTSTKNPSYSENLYTDGLIGSNTVNTLPEATAESFRERGSLTNSILSYHEIAQGVWGGLQECGIDMEDVAATLEAQGLERFAKSYDDALFSIGSKIDLVKMLG